MEHVNVPLLRKTMEHIKSHPEHWHQGSWRTDISEDMAESLNAGRATGRHRPVPISCGTAMCFAGWACELAGDEWEADVFGGLDQFFVSDHVMVDGQPVRAAERARDLLGLTRFQADRLFEGLNRLEDLEEIVADLTGEELL